MLFSEIYGSYFNVVAEVLKEAVNGDLTDKRLYEIVSEKAFAESVMTIPSSLKSGEWRLLTSDLKTPIKHAPTMPLTTLQKRWLKALLDDPRIKLFDFSADGLDDVEPLFTREVFDYFDRYSDGDPFENPEYIKIFKTIVKALEEKRKLVICYKSRTGKVCKHVCIPHRLEYSCKDDKFRLISISSRQTLTINIARITACYISEQYKKSEDLEETHKTEALIFELIDERNALERIMLSFSHLKKKTEKLDGDRYRVTLEYDKDDETEILIRILSFGPMIRVLSPQSFITLIKNRIEKQKSCGQL